MTSSMVALFALGSVIVLDVVLRMLSRRNSEMDHSRKPANYPSTENERRDIAA